MIDVCKLKEAIEYNPDTGELIWKRRDDSFFEDGARTAKQKAKIFNSHYEGKLALSHQTANGYLTGTFGKAEIKAHRAAWAIHFGEWPTGHIDHINGNGLDNRISNLRIATPAQNSRNKRKYKIKNGTSRYKGVSKVGDRWKACINADGKRVYIGLFKEEHIAALAYDLVASVMHGEFSRPNFPINKQAMAAFATEYARQNFRKQEMDGVETWTTKEAY